MSEIVEALALVAGNPATCAAIGSVQLFIAIAALLIAAHVAAQMVVTRWYRSRWPLAPAGGRERQIFDRAVRMAGMASLPRLRISDGVAGACTVGFWRPDICVSPALAEALDDDELEAVLLHELAHAARRDVLGAALLLFGGWSAVSLVSSAWIFAPALATDAWHVGAIRSRLLMAVAITAFVCLRFLVAVPGRLLRELTCDDLAVRWSGKPLALAAALVKVARMEPAAHLGTSGFAHHEVFTLRRVRRLIDYRSPRPRLALQRAASMLAVGALVALAMS